MREINTKQLLLMAGITVVVTALVYGLLALPGTYSEINLINRDIDSPLRTWLNGYLAVLFRFKIMGNFSWLVVPVFAFSVVQWTSLARWQKAFWLFYVLANCIVALKGYFNFRYVLVMLPVNVGILLFVLSKIKFQHTRASRAVLAFLAVLLVFNTGKFLKDDFLKKYSDRVQIVLNPDSETEKESVFDYLHREYGSSGQHVLVNNLPEFYFHSTLKGVYFWCGSDVLYHREGEQSLLKDRTPKEVARTLIDEFNSTLIFSHEAYARYNPDFEQFLNAQCRLVHTDGKGYVLYEVNPIE